MVEEGEGWEEDVGYGLGAVGYGSEQSVGRGMGDGGAVKREWCGREGVGEGRSVTPGQGEVGADERVKRWDCMVVKVTVVADL